MNPLTADYLMMYYERWELKDRLLERMAEGWSVLYAIPATNTSPPYTARTVEVCFIKTKEEPCPRCSFPYPDPYRIDREA